LAELAEKEGAQLLIDLGDRVTNIDDDSDRQCMREVRNALSAFSGPKHHLLGNHDVAILSPLENEVLLGVSMRSRVVDAGDFRLVLWQPGVIFDSSTGFSPVGPHLRWLAETLVADPRPVIVASHVPLSGYSMIGNRYFENSPDAATYPDAGAVRQMLAFARRAVVWISGHVHWNTVTSAGSVTHLTVQSMNEVVDGTGGTADAIALLELDGNQLQFDVRGNDPFFLKQPIGTLPPFSGHRVSA
jgi:hypothetical protein